MKLASLCLLFALTYSQYTTAQVQGPTTDSTKKAGITRSLKGKNTAKVEMIYKRYEVTHTNTRTGSSYTSTVDVPFVHINNLKPVRLDKRATVLEPYMRYCSQSMEQIRQGQEDIRKGRRYGLLMYAVGPVIAFSSLATVTGEKNPGVLTYTLLGTGAGTMFTGLFLKAKHFNRAQQHYEDAINIYNAKCYVGNKDSTKPTASASSGEQPSPKGYFKKGEDPFHHDTVKAFFIESDPMDYTAYGAVLSPFYIERSGLNSHVGYYLKGFATLHSNLNFSAEYSKAYGDNLAGEATGKGIGPWVNSGYVGPEPGALKKANSLNLLAAVHLIKREKDFDYTVKMSRGKFGKVLENNPGGKIGKQMKSMSLRVGFMTRNQVEEKKDDSNEFAGETYNLNDYQNKFTGWPVMMKSSIATVGIALNKINDIAVTMKDGKLIGYSGETNTYLDFMYAVKTSFKDNAYYTNDDNTGALVATQIIPMGQTPVSKIGFRLGIEQTLFRIKHIGMSSAMEIGVAPGPQEASMLNRGYVRGKVGIVFANRIR
jgi:hypothetical protein